MQTILNYIHDPMCSWCWAFRPNLNTLQENLPAGIQFNWLLGGLAPDTDQPMPAETRQYVQNHWRRIQQQVPDTRFNFDFWEKCKPRRTTYPACRAVIAASKQGTKHYKSMVEAIQQAYYLQARNPSDDTTLTEIATETGLDKKQFTADLLSPATHAELLADLKRVASLGVYRMPALILQTGDIYQDIPVNYHEVDPMLDAINSILSSEN